MDELPPQVIYDRTVEHLNQQGRRSLIMTPRGPEPAYRGDYGLRCPIGNFIPDPCYDSRMEGRGIADIFDPVLFPALVQELPWFRRNEGLLRALQLAHDLAQNEVYPDPLPRRLKGIAVRFKLSPELVVKSRWSWTTWT
jgi:hypothetical protein